ncbi:MAG: phosphoribosylglycinamide formyltransferase [bacterium]|nr:phosphoribosylglycinamide formyltransferase [bacterium]
MIKDKAKIVVLISGRGSNLESLYKNAINYKIVGVISNNLESQGLVFARKNQIEAVYSKREDFLSLKELKEDIYKKVLSFSPDFILLAGFMQIIEKSFVEQVYGKLINIHPSILPSFPGLHTHEQALKAGVAEHGCTVHFVDSGVDTGPVIAQVKVEVLPNDIEASLSQRVLDKEHIIYPWVTNKLALGEITLCGRCAKYSKQVIEEAQAFGFLLSH